MHFSGIILKKERKDWEDLSREVFSKFSQGTTDLMIDELAEERGIDLEVLGNGKKGQEYTNADWEKYRDTVRKLANDIKEETGAEHIFDYFSLDGFLNGEEDPDKEFTLEESIGSIDKILNNKDLLNNISVIVTPDLEVLSMDNFTTGLYGELLEELRIIENKKEKTQAIDKMKAIKKNEDKYSAGIERFRSKLIKVLKEYKNSKVTAIGIDFHN